MAGAVFIVIIQELLGPVIRRDEGGDDSRDGGCYFG